jgi:hypothetical protein
MADTTYWNEPVFIYFAPPPPVTATSLRFGPWLRW